MPVPPHRPPETIARHAAQRHARDPVALKRLLLQFSPERRPALLERLRQHLTFEPDPITPPTEPQ